MQDTAEEARAAVEARLLALSRAHDVLNGKTGKAPADRDRQGGHGALLP